MVVGVVVVVVYLSIYLFVYLYLSIDLAIYLSICNLQTWKRSNSARLPELLNLITSKRKPFCEASCFLNFEVGNIKKRSNSVRLPSTMEHWVQSWRPRANEFGDFSSPCLWSIAPATKNWGPGHTKCCACDTKSSSQNWRSDAPKCTPSQEIIPLTF